MKSSSSAKDLTALSKFLSFVLRHKPESIGLTLDRQGWVDIEQLRAASHAHGKSMSRAVLEELVATNPKQRFAISPDGKAIRASQGHSKDVDLGYVPQKPPEQLFHGTVASSVDAIRVEGLNKMQRHHVHLSQERETATVVGQRRGKPCVLTVRTGEMHREGLVFYRSANGVWLTEHVPPQYIEFPRGG